MATKSAQGVDDALYSPSIADAAAADRAVATAHSSHTLSPRATPLPQPTPQATAPLPLARTSTPPPPPPTLRQRVLAARNELLDLADIALGAAEVIELRSLLTSAPAITSLVLHGNELGDAGAAAVAELAAHGTLRSLNLYGNAISAVGAQDLCAALARPTCSLRALSLRANPLGPVAGAHLAAAFVSASSALRILNLGACLLGDDGVAALCAPSSKLLCTVDELFLDGNDISPVGCRALGAALGALGSACSVRRLFLSDNLRLGGDSGSGVQALASGVARAPSLGALEAERCGIEVNGARALFDVALPAPGGGGALQILILAHNPAIGDAGAAVCAQRLRALGEFAPASPATSPASSPTAAVTVAATATSVSSNSGLEWLDIADTGVTDAGALALATALRDNPAPLRKLFLGPSFVAQRAGAVGAAGTAALVKALAVNTTLAFYQGPGEPMLPMDARQENRARLLELTSRL